MFLLLCHYHPNYGMTCTSGGLLLLYAQEPSPPRYDGPSCQLAGRAALLRLPAPVPHVFVPELPDFAHRRLRASGIQRAVCRTATVKPQLINTAVFPLPLHHASFAVAVLVVCVPPVYLIQFLFGQLPSVFNSLPQYGQYFFFFQKLILLSLLPQLLCMLLSCLCNLAECL